MLYLFTGLEFYTGLLLVLALLFVLLYEAINGFHDTANSVATIISTHAMQAKFAVVMSGVFNFFGVLLGGLNVAYTIVHLLPTDILLNVNSTHSHALMMVFSLLLAAIIWNLSTWFFGIPASSSHTLIGAIIGIAFTHAIVTNSSIVNALNIEKIINIFISLILSPAIGFLFSGLIFFILRHYWSGTKKRRRIHFTPIEREKKDGKRKPPFWTRTALIISAVGVSFFHGANDGQKGIGLIMLVLIGVAPAGFVVNMNSSDYEIAKTHDALVYLQQYYEVHKPELNYTIKNKLTRDHVNVVNKEFYCDNSNSIIILHQAQTLLRGIKSYNELTTEKRSYIRCLLLCISDTANAVAKSSETSSKDTLILKKITNDLLSTIEYAPLWIIISVALALSIGTIFGWRRVAITISKKIGKKDMMYSQGVSAQVTTAIFICIASYTGMPVSTTQVLSSAIAGTIVVEGGGIQNKTIKNIILVWILTLPLSILLSGSLYWISLLII
ncbi:Low-affinity inorganic phosphate transporter 1 [Candidatus Hartigia pinicola]|nr:Low-affinity inorganic phosphate transporter 1 [Candidatus Hartigia pinicola]